MDTDLLFDQLTLTNRLGQDMNLGVKLVSTAERGYLFLHALKKTPSSVIAKNAEHLAHQLVSRFNLNHEVLDILELRDGSEETEVLRWRFEWVGSSARSAKSQLVTGKSQKEFLASMLLSGSKKPVLDFAE